MIKIKRRLECSPVSSWPPLLLYLAKMCMFCQLDFLLLLVLISFHFILFQMPLLESEQERWLFISQALSPAFYSEQMLVCVNIRDSKPQLDGWMSLTLFPSFVQSGWILISTCKFKPLCWVYSMLSSSSSILLMHSVSLYLRLSILMACLLLVITLENNSMASHALTFQSRTQATYSLAVD